MREAFGNVFIVNIIIIFVVVFIFLFAGSTSYTKAYKVKNKIINIIEENKGYDTEAKDQIATFLATTGYRISKKHNCPARNGASVKKDSTRNYRYCIYEYTKGDNTYYGVTAYMYFDLPLISSRLELPVYGETKMIGSISD